MNAQNQYPIAHPDCAAAQSPRSLWKQRDYLLLFSGQLVSAFGSRLSALATPLLILALTGSPVQAGLLGGVSSLPLLLLGLSAGALLDRWDRKWVMVVCDFGRALVVGSVAWVLLFDRLVPAHLFIAAFLDGVFTTFFSIAHSACLPNVVPKAQLGTAVAQSQSVDSIAQMLGPVLGGLCYGFSRVLPFGLDALSYLVSAGGLCLMRTPFQATSQSRPQQLGPAVWAGMHWLWQQQLLRFLMLLTLGLMLPAFGYTLVLILLAQQLGASPGLIGLILTTGGIGTLIGSLLAAPLLRHYRLKSIIIATIWPWVFSWLPLAFAPNLVVLGIANAVGYIVVPIYLAAQAQVRLTLVPDALQGRVNSIYRLVVFGCQPIGLAVTGLLLQIAGPFTTVFVLFIPQLALAVATLFWRSVWLPVTAHDQQAEM